MNMIRFIFINTRAFAMNVASHFHPHFHRVLLIGNRGATAIEYGLIAALIAVAAVTAMKSLGTKVGTTFNNASSKMG